MLSSKYIIDKTGISRATLNNYINLGILSKPVVQNPGDEGGGAKLLGYFPDGSLDRIELVRRLKGEGVTMAESAARIGAQSDPAGSRETLGEGGVAPAPSPNVLPLDPERRVLQL